MFNVQTTNCIHYSEPAVIQSRSQSRNEINTHTEHLETLTRKQERKANRVITLDGEKSKKVE